MFSGSQEKISVSELLQEANSVLYNENNIDNSEVLINSSQIPLRWIWLQVSNRTLMSKVLLML
jgi:hypothetical protein